MKTLEWVMGLELAGGGIAPYEGASAAYPEVSGYLIPTLYDYGHRHNGGRSEGRSDAAPLRDAVRLAGRLADWLVSIQKEDGSFPDMKGESRSFDTAACMEGLERAHQETGHQAYADAAMKARTWLKALEREDGAMLISPGSDRTHAYTMRVSGLIGSKKAAKYWKEAAWGAMRTHYAAYALEGMLKMGEDGFVMSHLMMARTVQDTGLMPFAVLPWWREGSGTDTCATAQMAILYHKCGMLLNARLLRAAVETMVQPDGSIKLGAEHSERNSWTAKWALDMWKALDE